LYSYFWPGNIRELQNAIEHAMVMSQEKTLLPEYLPQQIQQQTSPDRAMKEPPQTVNRFRDQNRTAEKTAIMAALEKNNGNQTAAARELGISRVTLWRKKTMFQLP